MMRSFLSLNQRKSKHILPSVFPNTLLYDFPQDISSQAGGTHCNSVLYLCQRDERRRERAWIWLQRLWKAANLAKWHYTLKISLSSTRYIHGNVPSFADKLFSVLWHIHHWALGHIKSTERPPCPLCAHSPLPLGQQRAVLSVYRGGRAWKSSQK